MFNEGNQGKVIIGKDTRISGDMLELALASGMIAMGVDVYLAGILPTPGVAMVTKELGAKAGIVISASHNPYYDNGIKIFNANGYKLSDLLENSIEQPLIDNSASSLSHGIRLTGRLFRLEDAEKRYLRFLEGTLPNSFSLSGLRMVIDCANGATFQIAPRLFKALGAEVTTLFNAPDGININQNCGSQHTDTLRQEVRKQQADVGLAFDGDGDRLIAADEKGNELTGDQILAICAHFLNTYEHLKSKPVVSTVMSNLGLKEALNQMGFQHLTSKVGDRYVLEKMLAQGAVIGGEDSGHLIFLEHHTTGDGLVAALQLLKAVVGSKKRLSTLAQIMPVYPQELINVDVASKPDLYSIAEIKDKIKRVEASLGYKGRVLVRYSGTQPQCRVMVEGQDAAETKEYCRQIADVVAAKLGK
jgi:phosphoglucosamine mutase